MNPKQTKLVTTVIESSLAELNLGPSHISAENLVTLLSRGPKLQTLDLTEAKSLSKLPEESLLAMSALEALDITPQSSEIVLQSISSAAESSSLPSELWDSLSTFVSSRSSASSSSSSVASGGSFTPSQLKCLFDLTAELNSIPKGTITSEQVQGVRDFVTDRRKDSSLQDSATFKGQTVDRFLELSDLRLSKFQDSLGAAPVEVSTPTI